MQRVVQMKVLMIRKRPHYAMPLVELDTFQQQTAVMGAIPAVSTERGLPLQIVAGSTASQSHVQPLIHIRRQVITVAVQKGTMPMGTDLILTAYVLRHVTQGLILVSKLRRSYAK